MITESTAMSYYHGLACSLQREGSDEPETGISILVFASNPENKGPSSKDAESHTIPKCDADDRLLDFLEKNLPSSSWMHPHPMGVAGTVVLLCCPYSVCIAST